MKRFSTPERSGWARNGTVALSLLLSCAIAVPAIACEMAVPSAEAKKFMRSARELASKAFGSTAVELASDVRVRLEECEWGSLEARGASAEVCKRRDKAALLTELIVSAEGANVRLPMGLHLGQTVAEVVKVLGTPTLGPDSAPVCIGALDANGNSVPLPETTNSLIYATEEPKQFVEFQFTDRRLSAVRWQFESQ